MTKVNDFMLQADRDEKAAKFEKRRLAWMKKRQRGKGSYIFRYGVLGFGGYMFLFFICWDALFNRPRLQGAALPWEIGGYSILFVSGFFFGLWEWQSNEKRYCYAQKQLDPKIEKMSN
ncbi:MAG: hypothetical protein WCF54_08605 [Terracidiphilus sp.]